MPSYMVVRHRAYWVREVMHVEADNEDHAEEIFLSDFDPELVIDGVFRAGSDQLYTPLQITESSVCSNEKESE